MTTRTTESIGRATIQVDNPKRHAMPTPIQYLDKAMTRLRDLGLVPEKPEEAPIVALLNRVSDLDQDKVVAIARTRSMKKPMLVIAATAIVSAIMSTVSRPELKPRRKLRVAKRQALIDGFIPCRDRRQSTRGGAPRLVRHPARAVRP